jgi:hypothetical protein
MSTWALRREALAADGRKADLLARIRAEERRGEALAAATRQAAAGIAASEPPLAERVRKLTRWAKERHYELERAFVILDNAYPPATGTLTDKELSEAYIHAGIPLGRGDLAALRTMTTAREGGVPWQEILLLGKKQFAADQRRDTSIAQRTAALCAHLSLWDPAQTGLLPPQAFKLALGANSNLLKMYLDANEVDRAIRDARPSTRADGRVDYAEWTGVLAQSRGMPWLLLTRTVRCVVPMIAAGHVDYDTKSAADLHRLATMTAPNGKVVETLGRGMRTLGT